MPYEILFKQKLLDLNFDVSFDMQCLKGVNDNIIYILSPSERISRYTTRDLLYNSKLTASPILPEDTKKWNLHCEVAKKRGWYDSKFRIRHKDIPIVGTRYVCQKLHIGKNVFIEFRNSNHDITKRKLISEIYKTILKVFFFCGDKEECPVESISENSEDIEQVAKDVITFSNSSENGFEHSHRRIMTKEEKVKWANSRINFQRNNIEKIIRYLCNVTNITGQKKSKIALTERKKWFGYSRTKQFTEKSTLFAFAGNYFFVNRIFFRMVSCTKYKLLEMAIFDMFKSNKKVGGKKLHNLSSKVNSNIFKVIMQNKNKSIFLSEILYKSIKI